MRLRPVLALLLVQSCHCAELQPGLIYQCSPNGECEDGLSCVDGFCVEPADGGVQDGGVDAGCIPTRTCDPFECGVVGDDGCGEQLDCSTCGEPFTCGLLNANRCGCIPFDAGTQVCPPADAGELCGDITVNNCGTFETFVCGPPACSTGLECSENRCCLPPTEPQLCATAGFRCGHGEAIDSCGTRRQLECGLCPVIGQTCVFTDEGSECVNTVCSSPQTDVEFCNSHGVNCGEFSGVDSCGQLRNNVRCGDECDAGNCTSTQANQCVCQGVLSGCRHPAQCCTGLTCGTADLCCVAPADPCIDDSDCCGTSWCSQNFCCVPPGTACTADKECCSGLCGSDGGCEYVDAGSTWDGGEL